MRWCFGIEGGKKLFNFHMCIKGKKSGGDERHKEEEWGGDMMKRLTCARVREREKKVGERGVETRRGGGDFDFL